MTVKAENKARLEGIILAKSFKSEPLAGVTIDDAGAFAIV